jgi:hypothetical protein
MIASSILRLLSLSASVMIKIPQKPEAGDLPASDKQVSTHLPRVLIENNITTTPCFVKAAKMEKIRENFLQK